MISEKVFKISGETGGISITRQKCKTGEKFLYHHSEWDPTDEGLDVNEEIECPSFAEPFQLINKKYNWFMLHVEIHSDYRNYIADQLIEKLNKKSIEPDYLGSRIAQLEHALKVEIKCELVKKEPCWSYTKTDK
jgi:hypothetical protein